MQPIPQSSTAPGKMETNEQRLFNNLEPLCDSLRTFVVSFNKYISEASEQDQIQSMNRLQELSRPELTIFTTIDERKIAGLKISMMEQPSGADLTDASQQREQRDIQYDSCTAKASGASAYRAASADKAEIFQCQANYLEFEKKFVFDRLIHEASFSPTSKHLVINGSEDEHDDRLDIWRLADDGNWLHTGELCGFNHHYEFNRAENTLLSAEDDGEVTVSTLSTDGSWEEAAVLEPEPEQEHYPKVQVAFSPLQKKIMAWDTHTGKINLLREDSNGRWIPLTQTKKVRHHQQWGPQQPPLQPMDNHILTYQGTTATIWSCNDDNNCLDENKVIECDSDISSAQMSDDGQLAVIFTVGRQVVFLGCDTDGQWLQIGQVYHPKWSFDHLNRRHFHFVDRATFNAAGQYAITQDSGHRVIISGYDNNGDWVIKTEIQDCKEARFSPSGRKLLARLLDPLDCINTDDKPDEGVDTERVYNSEPIVRRSPGTFKLWDCSSTGDRLDEAQTLEHIGSSDVIFSPSENLLLSYGNGSNFACIWGDDGEGNLVEKGWVSYQQMIKYAAFNPQEDSVLTYNDGRTVKIHGLNSQGAWQEQLKLQHQRYIRDARFSPSGCLAYSISVDRTACIMGRDDDGEWMKLAVTSPGIYSVDGASFNEPENHFLTYGNKLDRKDKHQPGLVQLWGIGDDDKWVQKEQIKVDYPVKEAKFSPDGDHLMIHCHDERRMRTRSEAGIALLWKIPDSPGQEIATLEALQDGQ
ncbi:WD40 repeat domain-containing protein [Endozoicomonas sp. SESOKO1]|uniref:WD40 repeat domain-containing protein n=1 Tax=Endozoicomonas sp. SESOKO1 TaxID=2828742 RepID=UPI0021478047|nr:WD40 repeat domain-containing protein [Endozoicomonas sp. SESOKO1]